MRCKRVKSLAEIKTIVRAEDRVRDLGTLLEDLLKRLDPPRRGQPRRDLVDILADNKGRFSRYERLQDARDTRNRIVHADPVDDEAINQAEVELQFAISGLLKAFPKSVQDEVNGDAASTRPESAAVPRTPKPLAASAKTSTARSTPPPFFQPSYTTPSPGRRRGDTPKGAEPRTDSRPRAAAYWFAACACFFVLGMAGYFRTQPGKTQLIQKTQPPSPVPTEIAVAHVESTPVQALPDQPQSPPPTPTIDTVPVLSVFREGINKFYLSIPRTAGLVDSGIPLIVSNLAIIEPDGNHLGPAVKANISGAEFGTTEMDFSSFPTYTVAVYPEKASWDTIDTLKIRVLEGDMGYFVITLGDISNDHGSYLAGKYGQVNSTKKIGWGFAPALAYGPEFDQRIATYNQIRAETSARQQDLISRISLR